MQGTMRLFTAIAATGAIAAAGCASPPALELQAAREALAGARDFEADIYASDQYELALMNLEMAETEIRDQEQVSAMGRSYNRALAYIDATIDEAERAQLMAEDYKALVFIQAEATLPVAQTALDDAFDMLQRARPVLAFQEAQAFDAQLAEMAAALNLARQQMDEGGFADAAARLDEIVIAARAIHTRAQFVIETAPQ